MPGRLRPSERPWYVETTESCWQTGCSDLQAPATADRWGMLVRL